MELVLLANMVPFLIQTIQDVFHLNAILMIDRSWVKMENPVTPVMNILIQMLMVLSALLMNATTQLSILTLTDPAKNVNHTIIPILALNSRAASKNLAKMVPISLIP